MGIKDLAGLSKPISKLIDVFQSGCSWVMEPTQIKRISVAKAETTSIKSTADFKKCLKDSLLVDTISATHTIREKRQFDNVASIYASAAQELLMIESVDDTPVDVDWSTRFFDYSKDISDKEAQIVWAKILAGEIEKPGSFFKRTLSVLRDIEAFEAKWFVDLCQFVLYDSVVFYHQFMDNYPYNQIQSLMDCGLLNSELCSFQINENFMEINGKTHSLKPIDLQADRAKMSFNAFSLTDAGCQLYDITQAQTNQDFMLKFKAVIEKSHNLKLEIVQNQ